MPICYKCGSEKLLEDFVKDNRSIRHICKKCRNKNEKEWRKNNPEKVKERRKRYMDKHRNVVNAYQKKYRKLYPFLFVFVVKDIIMSANINERTIDAIFTHQYLLINESEHTIIRTNAIAI